MNPKEKDSRNNNNKRWGNKFIDKRNWKSYNEELVMRGDFSANRLTTGMKNWIR